MQCFVNGTQQTVATASIGITDLALMRGYGIFDFFRTVGGVPLFLDDHLNRFYQSAEKLDLAVPFTRKQLKSQIESLQRANDLPESGFRLILTGGYSTTGYSLGIKSNLIITQEPIHFPSEQAYQNGVKLITHEYLRDIPEVKTINYITGIWLKAEIQSQNAFDVLYHHKGQMLELTRSNFFVVTNSNTIVTPSQSILKGITRSHLLQAVQPYYHVEERPITLAEIKDIKEAFLTGTTKRILPIVSINDQLIGTGRPGEVTHHAMALFKIVEEDYLI